MSLAMERRALRKFRPVPVEAVGVLPAEDSIRTAEVRRRLDLLSFLGDKEAIMNLLDRRLAELSGVSSLMRVESGKMVEVPGGGEIGNKDNPGSRMAFTEADFRSRDLIQRWVEDVIKEVGGEDGVLRNEYIKQDNTARVIEYAFAGRRVTIEQNPAGIIVIYHGEEDEGAVAPHSHIDTVNEGGRHDGQDGIVDGICVLEALIRGKVKMQKSVMFVGVTGEESGKVAFSGSQILVRGLTEEALDIEIEAGFTLREGLNQWARHYGIEGFSPEQLVGKRLVPCGTFAYLIEVHADPTSFLKDAGKPVGIATEIMGADRRIITVEEEIVKPRGNGDSPSINEGIPVGKYQMALGFILNGESGHHGSTPVVTVRENDGQTVIELSRKDVLYLFQGILDTLITAGVVAGINYSLFAFEMPAAAMNKIPGEMQFGLLISSDYENLFKMGLSNFLDPLFLIRRREEFQADFSSFDWQGGRPIVPFKIEDFSLSKVQLIGTSKFLNEMELVLENIQRTTETFGKSEIEYGEIKRISIGTVNLSVEKKDIGENVQLSFKAEMGMDMRAFNPEDLTLMRDIIEPLFMLDDYCPAKDETEFKDWIIRKRMGGKLPGSEPPVRMKPEIIELLEKRAEAVGIPVVRQQIFAGEDILVLQEGIDPSKPGGGCFVTERSNGFCHVPEEAVDTEDRIKALELQAEMVRHWGNVIE